MVTKKPIITSNRRYIFKNGLAVENPLFRKQHLPNGVQEPKASNLDLTAALLPIAAPSPSVQGEEPSILASLSTIKLQNCAGINGAPTNAGNMKASLPGLDTVSFDMTLLERLKDCNPALTLLNTTEVAAIFRVSVKKCENDRYLKRGIKFIKISGTVRYRLSDVLAEMEKA